MNSWLKYPLALLAGIAVVALPVLLLDQVSPPEERQFGWLKQAHAPKDMPEDKVHFGWDGGPANQEFAGNPQQKHFGWVPDPDAVKNLIRRLKFKHFAETPAYRADAPLPTEVFMWKAYQQLFDGKLPPSKNQSSIGSCVSFGTNNAVARTLAVAIAFGGASYGYKDIAEEVTYGGGRQQICHQGVGGDGTNGSCCAKFVQQYGICPRENVGGYDLTTYSVATCRSFGNKGAPKTIIDAMATTGNKVKDITLVRTWDEAKTCLANGWGIAICSGVGFQSNRDANGIKVASGSWSHCMCLDGYCTIAGKEYGHIENSWGDDNNGPTGPGSPSKAGFWASAATINKMLAAGDSWAFSNVVGFESQKINWLVLNEPRQQERHVRVSIAAGICEARNRNVTFAYLTSRAFCEGDKNEDRILHFDDALAR